MRAELNEWEQRNILEAERWAFGRRRLAPLSLGFIKQLHLKMFNETWVWAGKFRTSDKTIGVPWYDIQTALEELLRDTSYWLERGTYEIDIAAARFHHRLTYIHPFPNGNGRHARLITDVLLAARRRKRFDWGADLNQEGDARSRYIAALGAADGGDYDRLFEFLNLAART